MDFSQHTLLQVIPKLEGGGAERTTLEVGRAFVEAGGRSLVVSSGGGMVDELEAGGSAHVEMPVESKNPFLIAQNARDLAALIAKEKVSLIHARSRAPAWSCLQAARRTGIPFVTTYHGAYSAKSALKKLYNSVMVRSDAIIANSQFTAEAVAAQYEGKPYFDRAKMVTIPRGADLSRFDPEAVSEERIETFKTLFGPGFRIVLPGRFTDWKGQREVVEAAAILKKQRPDIRATFLMVGRMDEKPDYVEELRELVDQRGVTGSVQLIGPTKDVPALLLASDVVLSASTRPEAFGRVAVEAQAAGRPVIATAHGGSLETVRDGETGILVPPGDSEALAKALIRLHDLNPEERAEMGRRGMMHAHQNFTTEAMTASTLSVYQKLIGGLGDGTNGKGS
ncbi:glycosyltransferase family 4 protein [Parvularcula lutaonensis]|uniref:Glycosyltransferase family 4 protein n=1 Tax=Parvularcula lutaonensis TaxID=491923 RepID=A0ABV7MEB4_9PROT|nr:glycosyltransferase family 4 protein [Parvularcula lutaonensis]GGY55062.1 glycosyl transferase [Parvularcula lutaonensis]